MRTAIVLFNLGGPDSLDAVEPFLFNLFNDKAILGAPGFIRRPLACYISRKRGPKARAIYARIGGRSPLLEQTERQAVALEEELGEGYKTFIAMRYWHPMTEETVKAVATWNPDRIVLLPLYPQYSCTTTGSSFAEWNRLNRMSVPSREIREYPTLPGFVDVMAARIRQGWTEARSIGRPRVLFSAHGLPQKVIDRGDPYQAQVEAGAAAIAAAIGIDDLDWLVCYQSRVGPMKWIGPSTEEELARAGQDLVPVVIAPIAFVSEHSETLVELDIEYREKARDLGIPAYVRIGTVGDDPVFIAALAGLVRETLDG